MAKESERAEPAMSPRAAAVDHADRPDVIDLPLENAPEPPNAAPLLVGALAFGGGVGALLGLAVRFRPLFAFAVAGAVVAFVLAWLHARTLTRAMRERAARIPRLRLDRKSLAYIDGDQRTTILELDRRFGVTLLASPTRAELVVAITHRDGIEYLAARNPSAVQHLDILARAITTPENDLPIGDRVPTFREGDRLLELVAELESRAAGAVDRVFLSDAGMADVVLDGKKLRAGQLDFDLQAPLSWRSYSFQEGSSFASHSFQATQIRQGDREIVLVALSPTGELATPSIISPPAGHKGPLTSEVIQRSLARDLRLAHCLAEIPPPRSQRVAMDRLFVPRIRMALDLAPAEAVRVPRTLTPAEALLTPADGIEQLRQSSPDVR